MLNLQKYIINAIENNALIDPDYITSRINNPNTIDDNIRDILLFLSDIANHYTPTNCNPNVNRVVINTIDALFPI